MAAEGSKAGKSVRTAHLPRILAALCLSGFGILLSGEGRAATEQNAIVHADVPAGPADVTLAVAAHVERNGNASKLTFDLSRPATARSLTLENPDRIVIETSDIAFQIAPEVGKLAAGAGGVIRSFRFGHFAPGRSRIVIDLAGPARVQQLGVSAIASGDPSRLTIQLARCDRAAFHDAALHNDMDTPQPAAAIQPEQITDTRPVIVVDPGHGGVDPGAAGVGGAVEKKIVFDFGSALAESLRATGRYRIVMTRADDTFVSLGERVKVARDAKAALFVSIHADTLANGPDVTGATVYTAADRASDVEAARVAETENKADEAAGVVETPDASDVSDILFDLTRRETRTFSHAFQHTLTGYWQKIARLNHNPERSAGFKVLQAPDVPSVLLELGYLSNASDVAALTSADWRGKATASIVASIDTFFASRRPTAPTEAAVDLKTGDPDKTAVVVLRPHL